MTQEQALKEIASSDFTTGMRSDGATVAIDGARILPYRLNVSLRPEYVTVELLRDDGTGRNGRRLLSTNHELGYLIYRHRVRYDEFNIDALIDDAVERVKGDALL